jgi:peptide/nickel transport system substrate-binding protein
MTKKFAFGLLVAALAVCLILPGCFSSSSGPSGVKSGGDNSQEEVAGSGSPRERATPRGTPGGGWNDYPDVPYVPIMEDIDGIEIPRVESAGESGELAGEVPVDVGNEHAQRSPGQPVTGDRLIVRFNSEPKTLNPIVESSAVQTYIMQYALESLAWQNPETFELEPHIAQRWVAEDSVKLSPDYPGKERRVSVNGGQPAGDREVEYRAVPEGSKEMVLDITTSNAQGQTIGNVWVGLYPLGDNMPGAPKSGYHFWSKEDGSLEVSGIVPGKYKIRVGAEIYGETSRNEDGSLTVKAATPQNPLHDELKSGDKESLQLAAEEWVDVQEQTIYTYFLRPEVTWSDGTPFTTKDLQFAYAVINNPYVDGDQLRVYYSDLVACDPLDDHTIRMKYRQQYFQSLEFTSGLGVYTPPWHQFADYFKQQNKTLTLEELTPDQEQAQNKVSAHGQTFGRFFNTDDRYNRAPLGTGPYIVDRWQTSTEVVLRRNPNYWNPERAGYLDRLIFKFIPDNVTAMRALQAGEIDFLYRMDPEQFFEDLAGPPDWFKDRYVKASWYSPGFGYVGWNLRNPLFADRRVRTALALLFNAEEFLEKKLHNEAVLVSGSQYFFGPGYDHEVKPLGYDPEVARDLLAEAGWIDSNNDGVLDKDGRRFEFEFLLPPGNPVNDDRAALMQRSLRSVGIRMEIRNYEWASFIDKVRAKDFDAVTMAWASPIESDPFQIWHGSQAGADKRGSNFVSFRDPVADELIEMLRLTLDKEKRKRIHWSFHRIIDREQPYMFLYTPKDFGAYHKRFHGVKWYAIRPGFDFTEWYVPKDQQRR